MAAVPATETRSSSKDFADGQGGEPGKTRSGKRVENLVHSSCKLASAECEVAIQGRRKILFDRVARTERRRIGSFKLLHIGQTV
jgi:hypothetical protein